MITKREFLKRGFAGIAAGLGAAYLACKEKPGEKNSGREKSSNDKNPFEYNIEEFRKVNESEIIYKEEKPYLIKAKNLDALSVTDDGRLIVSADSSIFILSKNSEKQWKIAKDGQCIAVYGDEIFLGVQGHVEIYNFNGKKTGEWNNFSEKTYITSITVNGKYAAVADSGNRFVWLLDKSGALQLIIGRKDDSKKTEGLSIPSPFFDVAFDGKKFLWLANTGKTRVEKYTLKGELVAKWGIAGMSIEGFSGCCNPSHFALLPGGGFVTAEKGLERVKVFDTNGNYKGVVARPADFIPGTVGLDLAVDRNGKIYVLDPGKKMVRVFVKK